MLTLRDLDKIDDGGLWEKLKKEIQAETNDPNQQLHRLTQRVLEGFITRLGEDHAANANKNKNANADIKKPFLDNNVTIRRQPRTPRRVVITRPDHAVTEPIKDGEEIVNEKNEIIIQKKGTKRRLKNSGEGEKKIKKQKKGRVRQIDPKKELVALGLEPARDMPEEFKNVIHNLGGTEIKLVMQKIIYATDLSATHSRLSMPMSQFRSKFLSEVEDDKLKNGEIMNVMLVEPCLRISQIHFGRWMLGSPVYIFRTEWNDVVRNNRDTFKKKAVVQVWSFRTGAESRLGFAMVKVRDGEEVERAQ